jgi:phosphoribosylformylglycinamidine synthase
MLWRVEVRHKPSIFDASGESIRKDIIDLGIKTISQVSVLQIYRLLGNLSAAQIERISQELLIDPVTQQYSFFEEKENSISEGYDHSIEIAHNPGVMDPVEESVIKGIRDLGFIEIKNVRTSRRYLLTGSLSSQDRNTVVNKVLCNKLIQHEVTREVLTEPKEEKRVFRLLQVELIDASDKKLLEISQKGQLYLNLNEMKQIRAYFRKLKRNPTDCELETIAQTWSEHCYHKTFRGKIRYASIEKGKKKIKIIKNLFRTTIAKATEKINRPWCVSVFHDNAGVIRFDEDSHVCFKVETHNHPSALEPFGGANTGIGGVIRDILGTGLGAKPICSTDVFCFAPPDMSFAELPPGTLHPKRVMKGVVSGVRDYGNKMGIPTVNGAILFDKKFVGNPLVYCGTVGLIPKDKVKKAARKGDLAVVVGGRTGRDGIHGATFSSGELTIESEVISSGAVQIGNPIQEKKVLDALLLARDANLYTGITDCGAGGLSSAVGEMGKDLGVRVQLEDVPLKYRGLNYTEIWISESQERMVLSVPPKNRDKLLQVFADENVEATVIGEFTGKKSLEIFYQDYQVCELDMEFLHGGIPDITKEAVWKNPPMASERLPKAVDLNNKLKEVFSNYNVCSKEWVIRQYDHEVQGGTVVKPLVGVHCDGPSDASVVCPKLGSSKGIAVSNGINFRYGMIDPYWMAASCIDEAIRQVVSVGGSFQKIAILDNFCWGNPDKPDRLGSLVRAAEGCYQFALGYKTPFISGKDSLYNEYTEGNKSIAIPGTLLISALGIVEDVTKAVTMDLKQAGNLIYVIGDTYDELGGSIYLSTYDMVGSSVPKVDVKKGFKIFSTMDVAIKKGLIRSSHDCSEGGLAVALAEMAFSGGLGVDAALSDVPYKGKLKRDDVILFSESNTRFIVEVEPKNQKAFEKLFRGVSISNIGAVQFSQEFRVRGLDGQECVRLPLSELKEAWQKPLRF